MREPFRAAAQLPGGLVVWWLGFGALTAPARVWFPVREWAFNGTATLPACGVLVIGPEGVVQCFLVVQLEDAAAFLSLWPLGQFHSETLQRQTLWGHFILINTHKDQNINVHISTLNLISSTKTGFATPREGCRESTESPFVSRTQRVWKVKQWKCDFTPKSKSKRIKQTARKNLVLSNQESFGAGAGDSVPPHLASCEGVEHLVFEEEPQPLPLPLALLPTMEAAAHCGALHSKSNLIKDKTNTHTQKHTRD